MTDPFALGARMRGGRLGKLHLGAYLLTLAVAAGLVLALPAVMRADTYNYTGSALGQDSSAPTPTTGLTNVSGFFTITGALGNNLVGDDITALITGFSFGDGLQTISSGSTLTAEDFVVDTDGSGNIINWAVNLATSGGSILSCHDVPQTDPYPSSGAYAGDCEPGTGFGGTGDEVQTAGEIGLVVPGNGSWSVPEPSSVLLLAVGLLGLIGMARRRKGALAG